MRQLLPVLGLLVIVLFAGQTWAQMESEWVYRVAPSRPQVQTIWQSPALPIGERDLIAIAERLGLTREQTMAFESMLPEYLDQACALRRNAIKAIASEGVIYWSDMRESPPIHAMEKSADARLAFERSLATLETALFDRLGEVLAAEQQEHLPAERLRRERQRLFTDDVMISVCGEGPLLIDLGEVVDSLDLSPDERNAAQAILARYDAQAASRIRAVFEASVKECIQMATAMAEPGRASLQVTQNRVSLLQKTIEFEQAYVDQIASVLSPDAASDLRVAHAREIWNPHGRGMHQYMESMATVIADAENIDAEVKQRVAELLAKSRADEIENLPELMHITRIMNIYNTPWRLGGIPMMMTSELWQSIQPLQQRQQELLQKSYQGFRELNDLLEKSITQEQRQAIRDAASKIDRSRYSGLSAQEYSKRFQFGSSNIVTMVSMGGELWVMSSDAEHRRVSAMKRLGLGDDAGEVAAAAVEYALDRWNESAADVQRRFAPLVRYTGEREAFDLSAHEKATNEAIAALESMRTLVPAAVESLGVVIDDPRLRERAITTLLWSDITDPPHNCPAPMEIVHTSHYRTVTTMLDRVDPAAILLDLDGPAEAFDAAWQVLRNEAAAGEQRVWSMRKRVAEAMAISARTMQWQHSTMSMHRENPQGMDWSVYRVMQQAAAEACRAAQQARRDHVASLEAMHERVSSALPEDYQLRYREAVNRQAFPDAWMGIDRAQRLVDFALTLPEITDDQRQQTLAVLSFQQARLQSNANELATQIAELNDADDMTRESWKRRAPMYGLFEQLCFERDQEVDALLRLLRPILSADHMLRVTNERFAR